MPPEEENAPLPTFEEPKELETQPEQTSTTTSASATTTDSSTSSTAENPKKRPLESTPSRSATPYSSRFRDSNNNVNPYARNTTPNTHAEIKKGYYEAKRSRKEGGPMHPSRKRDVYIPQSQPPRPFQSSSSRHYEEDSIEAEIARKNANLDKTVRAHYNQRTYESRKSDRNKSPIIKLKHFNNAIKYMLIGKYTNPGDRALDLGCGKGGDINKWQMANIKEYVGVDISDASIKEAVKRYRSNRPTFEVTFVTGDGFGLPLPAVFKNFPGILDQSFDVVSMQFCLHYGFETEQKAKCMIENVAKSLRVGGKFIGTIPNSDFISYKLKRLPEGEKSFGNSLYNVTFLESPPKDGVFVSHYGNVYNYYLQDAIDNVPEYVVPFDAFRGLCEDFGLRLIEKKVFNEFFKENIPQWYSRLNPKIIEGMRRRKDNGVGVEGDESDATANFYLTFAFEKI